MSGQNPDLEWRDGTVPVSRRFDDPYFSFDDGLAETAHVFLDGNDLPARFRPRFHIAELGFGTGLNFLATWQAWRDSGANGPLLFTSFEAFPLSANDMRQALAAFPALDDEAALLCAAMAVGPGPWSFDGITLDLRIGDARDTLPEWAGAADAWFLDGFAPAKNPELWDAALMAQVFAHSAMDGTFATYTAAGAVRRALSDAGFEVNRRPGFGRKRHMTVGRKRQ